MLGNGLYFNIRFMKQIINYV